MPWPKLHHLGKAIDISWWQNQGWPFYTPMDLAAVLAANPQVELVIMRAVWPDGSKDQHYDGFYDAASSAGRRVSAYLWPNPVRTLSQVIEDWKRALGDRVPPLIGVDYEESSTFEGVTKGHLTTRLRDAYEAVETTFDATAMNYSRANWLDGHILAGDWVGAMNWWLAHWIYPPTLNRQAQNYAEVDALLPIDNSWTPYRGGVIKIPEANVVGWQFTSQGRLSPWTKNLDLDYFKRTFLSEVYGSSGDDPEPPPDEPELVPVELRVPKDRVTVTVTET